MGNNINKRFNISKDPVATAGRTIGLPFHFEFSSKYISYNRPFESVSYL